MQRWTWILPVAVMACLAAGQESQTEPVHKVGEGITPPRIIFAPDPSYTLEAWQKGITGKVSLKLEVLPDGRTNNIRVVKPLDPSLDQSAVEAVAHWRFQPATKNGAPISIEISVVVGFLGPTSASPRPGVYTGLPCAAKIDSRDIKTLLKKASKGDPKAQITIGCAYQYGLAEMPPDRAQAISWYRKAAEIGLVPAQHFLGEAYLLNFDYVRAYTWLTIANSGGYKDPNDKLKIVTTLLNADQISDAEAQVAEWKRQHGTK